jgi:hypothetical protein
MNKFFLSAAIATTIITSPALAEDLSVIVGRVQEYAKSQNYPKALEELQWAQKELQKLHAERVKSFLPDQLQGYHGQKLESSGALGFSQIERKYVNGEKTVTISITGNASSGGMGNLAQLGKMAAMFGGESGNETIRVKGHTAQLEKNDNSASITVFLDSGAVLKVNQDDSPDDKTLLAIVEELKLEELEKYLKG